MSYAEPRNTMRALVLDVERRAAVPQIVSAPDLSSDEILVEVRAVALNPVDSLYTAQPLALSDRVVGSDFAGVVVALGSSVPSSSALERGSRVAGFVQGASSINDRPGAFAEYIAIPWDLIWKIGDMAFHEAATISLCALTAAQALFLRLKVPAPFPLPNEDPEMQQQGGQPTSIFINGATTSVGLFAAQLIRCTGSLTSLYGTASTKHFEMLRAAPYEYAGLGDWRTPEVWPRMTNSGVDIAFDCISEGLTVEHTLSVLSQGHHDTTSTHIRPRLAVVRSKEGGAWTVPTSRLWTEPSYGAVWEGLGEAVQYAHGINLAANPASRAFTVAFYEWLSRGDKLLPIPARVMPGDLSHIVTDGFELLGYGKMNDRSERKDPWMRPISAEKLVYIIDR